MHQNFALRESAELREIADVSGPKKWFILIHEQSVCQPVKLVIHTLRAVMDVESC